MRVPDVQERDRHEHRREQAGADAEERAGDGVDERDGRSAQHRGSGPRRQEERDEVHLEAGRELRAVPHPAGQHGAGVEQAVHAREDVQIQRRILEEVRIRIAAEEADDDADEQQLVGPGVDDRQAELQSPEADGEPERNDRDEEEALRPRTDIRSR